MVIAVNPKGEVDENPRVSSQKILAEFGIPIPRGGVATTPAEAKKIAAELRGKVVIKAQVYAGGRGKAGGIKTADTSEEAEEKAESSCPVAKAW